MTATLATPRRGRHGREDAEDQVATEHPVGPNRHWPTMGACGWMLAMALALSAYSPSRHYQVDEFQYAFEVSLLTRSDSAFYEGDKSPLKLALAAWLGPIETSLDELDALRAFFAVLFMLNLVLMAFVQPYFRTPAGRLAVLLAASTLIPFWRYGIEIRHDNLMLLGELLFFGIAQLAVRTRRPSTWLWCAQGAVAAAVQMHSFKAVAYWLPFSLILLLIDFRRGRCGRNTLVRSAGAFLAGAAAVSLPLVTFVAASGHLSAWLDMWRQFIQSVPEVSRFSPLPLLCFTLESMPHVTFLALLAIAFWFSDLPGLMLRESLASVVTSLYFLCATSLLFVNPTPFGYNVLHFVPFVLFASLDAMRMLLDGSRLAPTTIAILAMLFLTGAPLLREESFEPQFVAMSLLAAGFLWAGARKWLPVGPGLLIAVALVLVQVGSSRASMHLPLAGVAAAALASCSTTRGVIRGRHLLWVAAGAITATAIFWITGEPEQLTNTVWNEHITVSKLLTVSLMLFACCTTAILARRTSNLLMTLASFVFFAAALAQSVHAAVLITSGTLLSLCLTAAICVAVTRLTTIANRGGMAFAVLLAVSIPAIGARTDEYLYGSNGHQRACILFAETISHPGEPVYDGVGMVLARPAANPKWLLHSSLMAEYDARRRPAVDAILRESKPPIVVTNYRWKWLAERPPALLRDYDRVADDIYVARHRADQVSPRAIATLRTAPGRLFVGFTDD